MKRIVTVIFTGLILFISTPTFANTVIYNTKTQKYHAPYCQWAKRCTKNCIKIEKQKAIRNGGMPCKVCGGG